MGQRIVRLGGRALSGAHLRFLQDALFPFHRDAERIQDQRNMAKGKRAQRVAQARAQIDGWLTRVQDLLCETTGMK